MSCEPQQGNGPLPKAVYLSILTVLPGDYFWCSEGRNIISVPKIKLEYNKALLIPLNKPFNLLFHAEHLFPSVILPEEWLHLL